MINKIIALPNVQEEGIHVIANNNRFPLDIIFEHPPVEGQERQIDQMGTLAPNTSEAFRLTFDELGKHVWRLLK